MIRDDKRARLVEAIDKAINLCKILFLLSKNQFKK
jgi:hypothetical protein